MSDWITLDEAAALARCRGAGAATLGEVLSDGFKARRIGVTALLEGPLIDVSVPWPDHLGELAVMQFRRVPQHVEDLLARAIGSIVVLSGNRLQACIAWHGDAPPYVADTITLCEVRVYRSALESALEEVGFTRADGAAELPAGVEPRGAAKRRQGTGRGGTANGRREASERSAKPQQRRAAEPGRHGPEPGATGFAAADKALFAEIERMRSSGEVRSMTTAALNLVKQGKVAGYGTDQSKATRLARRFGTWKSTGKLLED